VRARVRTSGLGGGIDEEDETSGVRRDESVLNRRVGEDSADDVGENALLLAFAARERVGDCGCEREEAEGSSRSCVLMDGMPEEEALLCDIDEMCGEDFELNALQSAGLAWAEAGGGEPSS